jgi:hypothetical protein
MKLLYLISLFLCTTNIIAQTKHALIVAIGTYPNIHGTSNWSSLSSLNDATLVKKFLLDQGFEDNHIDTLYDAQATSANLASYFENVIHKLSEGDIFYFHFSGHGQQVADITADSKFIPKEKRAVNLNMHTDEVDGYDEALVMYNAPVIWPLNYNISEHFIDDQINFYTRKIREKIGPKGQLILLLDACHSGTATRGSENIIVRGQSTKCEPEGYTTFVNSTDNTLGFDADIDVSNNGQLGNMIAFFGCKAEQVNHEIKDDAGKGYGSLTYYFIKSAYELKDQASYQNLFSKINEKMILQFRNAQHPVIEGDDLNTLVFNAGLIPQKPFFDLTKLTYNEVSIKGGTLIGLQIGDSLGFYSSTSTDPQKSELFFKGCITECNLYSSKIIINKKYIGAKEDYVKYRAFLINSVNNSATIRLKINVNNKTKRKELTKYFEEKSNVQLMDKDFDYQIVDTLINNEVHARIYLGNNTVNALREMNYMPISSISVYDEFSLYLNQSLKADAFRKIQMSNPKMALDINVYKRGPIGSEYDTTQAILGNFQVQDGDYFGLKLSNKSEELLYINIIDIYPDNRIVWVDDENNEGAMRNIRIKPSERKMPIKIRVGKPFGMEQFKIIVSATPLYFSQLEEIGSSLSRGSEDNPLMNFVNSTISGTRSVSASNDASASVTNIFFEIIP